MAEIINNTASTTYTLSGSTTPNTITSNELPLNFDNSGGITVTKVASPTTYSAGSIIDYTVTITNSSTMPFTGVRIVDNLGGDNLAYVLSSATITTSTQTYPVTPIATNPLTFSLQELAVGDTMTLKYKAQVIFNLSSSVNQITNSLQAIGYTSTGAVTAFAYATITRATASSFSITKSANQTTLVPNQGFSYLLTLTNGNSVAANVGEVTDNLPANFNLTGVKLQIGTGSVTTLAPSDYTVSDGNVLVVPSSTGPSITVPANGTTVVTLTGYFS